MTAKRRMVTKKLVAVVAETMPMDIVFTVPGRDAKGWLRRQKKSIAMMRRLTDNELDPAKVDELVEFLLPFIEVPVDRDEARDMLLDVSRDQFDAMLKKSQGIEDVPLAKS